MVDRADEELLRQPIGYWVKRVDEALTAHINRLLEERGLTRHHWMVLSVVRHADGAGVSRDEVFAAMRSFVDDAGLDALIDDFVTRGWMARRPDPGTGAVRLALTDAGRAGDDEVAAVIHGVRKQALDGISEDEYISTIKLLRRMVANLGEDPGPGPRVNPGSRGE